jgi:hypothetical protein
VARAAGVPSRNVNLWLKRKRHLPDEKKFLSFIATLGGTPEEWGSRWRHADAVRRGLATPDRRSMFSAAALVINAPDRSGRWQPG